MLRALVIQHAAVEGVGRLADWLPAAGMELRVLHPYAGDRLPDVAAEDALIVMGGPMGAYDDADVPWLPATKQLLRSALDLAVPTLGICLGAQLLAVAAGGTVERGSRGPELGIGEVRCDGGDELLDEGSFPVVQWHYDAVTHLPPGAVLLASSEKYPVQAFRFGDAAWGLQFHIEAAPEMVAEWARADGHDVEEVVRPVRTADDRIVTVGRRLARRFAEFVSR